MLIYNGSGFVVVPAVIFASFFFARWCTDSGFVPQTYFYVVAILSSSPVVGLLGFLINRERIVPDPQTQQPIKVKPNHSLYFVPLQYWGLVLFIAGLVAWGVAWMGN